MPIVIDLKTKHTLYDENDEETGGIGYANHGTVFLKKDLSEVLHYCEAL